MSAVPSANVAMVSACASVIKGVSRCRNALLNGDTHNYDFGEGACGLDGVLRCSDYVCGL